MTCRSSRRYFSASCAARNRNRSCPESPRGCAQLSAEALVREGEAPVEVLSQDVLRQCLDQCVVEDLGLAQFLLPPLGGHGFQINGKVAMACAEFVESYRAVLRPGSQDSLAKGNCPEIVPARDVRLGARLEGTKQPCHGAGKGVGKPGLGPPRAVPGPVIAAARVIERAGYASRPAGPADGALGKSLGALESPADADVGSGPFTRRTAPDIVPARRPGTRGILKNVKVDAIGVGERRPGVGPRAAQHAKGIAQPVAKGIEVVNAHEERRQ